MRKIIRAAAAIMIVAAICVLPLSAVQETDAAIIAEGSDGLSFKIGEMSNADADRLLSAERKSGIAYDALALATGQSEDTISHYWALSDVKVTGVKNLRMAVGTDASADRIENFIGRGLECTVSFTATVQPYQSPRLFSTVDGTQKLDKFIGSETAPSGSTMEVEGTFAVDSYTHLFREYYKTENRDLIILKSIDETAGSQSFSGNVTYTTGTGADEKVREYKVTADSSSAITVSTDYDYGNVAKDKVKADTEVFAKQSYDKYTTGTDFRYTISDDEGDGYGYLYDLTKMLSPLREYAISKAEDHWIQEDVPLQEYRYYGTNSSTCLMTNAGDDGLKTNTKMEEFLKEMYGGEVADEYSVVKSVADSTHKTIAVGGTEGNGNLILYVIIGALAVALVAVSVVAFRKK